MRSSVSHVKPSRVRHAVIPNPEADRFRHLLIGVIMRRAKIAKPKAEHFADLFDSLIQIGPLALRKILDDVYPVSKNPRESKASHPHGRN